jgi:2'-5' RNA ligase
MKRVFAAIDISEEVREEVRNYIEDLRSGFDGVPVKWEKPEKLHITVKFAGSVDEYQLNTFREQIRVLARSLEPFQIRFSGTGAFAKRRGPSVLWLGTAIVEASGDPFEVLGRLSEKRPFRPHLTIARIKDPKKAADLIRKHKSSEFESPQYEVSEIVLYESALLPTGSVYTRLARFSFGATQ